jgi:predicted nucleotidyltransferase
MNSLGEAIRKLRKERGLPLRVVAAQLGVDQAILSKVERGLRPANRDFVTKCAYYFKIAENELIKIWLSDKLVKDVAGENVAMEALIAAEERMVYELTLKPNLDELIPKMRQIFSGIKAVKKAWIFGSVARGEAFTNSDLDVLVEVPANEVFTLFDLAEIQERIQNVVKRKVDVVMLSAIKPLVKARIKNDLKLVYEA